MSALAVLLKESGWNVTGSDTNFFEPIPSYLKRNKIKFNAKYSSKNISKDIDLVIIGKNVNLSPQTNPEVKEALRSNIPIKSLPEILALLAENKESLVIVGSYGKSTATALASWCLKEAHKDPSYFIGAIPIDFKNSSHLSKGKEFVIEGDEYPSSNADDRSKFLHFSPSSVMLISGMHDHVNIFKTEQAYKETYKKLMKKIPKAGILVYALNAKNNKEISKEANCKKVSYALDDKKANWYGVDFNYSKNTTFTLVHNGKKIANITTKLLGKHNVENIIGVGALLLEEKRVSVKDFVKAIKNFSGIKRRIELKNKTGIPVYEGFGSSYEKTRAIFETLHLHFPNKDIVAVFEPHAFSWRNKKFLPWYKNIFNDVKEVILLPAVSRGKKAEGQISSKEILREVKKHKDVFFAKTEKDALAILKKIVTKNDVIALVSSGPMLGLTASVPKLFK